MDNREELIDKMFAELPEEMQKQAILTNKAFLEMTELERKQEDLNERLEMARLAWKREDRIWKNMLFDYKK